MSRQIIILETNPAEGGMISTLVAFWFPVTKTQEVWRPAMVSVWKSQGGVGGPSDAETLALQQGEVIEEVRSIQFPQSSTQQQILDSLVSIYNDRASYRAGLPTVGKYYGMSWDGNGWS